ncbi:MAG: hypothetical protein SH850_21855 [Planctomycetaceae bacterium]|nr:hypothetical protein [Planctomycetaceae bacterium]
MASVLTAPVARPVEALEYLLLGDLLAILEDAPGVMTSRWLLALLDRILSMRTEIVLNPALPRGEFEPTPGLLMESAPELIVTLQRLRDRVAMRVSYQLLANDVRCELRMLLRSLSHQ